jgi:hypothetical protein
MIVETQAGPFPPHGDDSPETRLGDVESLKVSTAKAAVGQPPILYLNAR